VTGACHRVSGKTEWEFAVDVYVYLREREIRGCELPKANVAVADSPAPAKSLARRIRRRSIEYLA